VFFDIFKSYILADTKSETTQSQWRWPFTEWS